MILLHDWLVWQPSSYQKGGSPSKRIYTATALPKNSTLERGRGLGRTPPRLIEIGKIGVGEDRAEQIRHGHVQIAFGEGARRGRGRRVGDRIPEGSFAGHEPISCRQ